jgi:hypothetical protein
VSYIIRLGTARTFKIIWSSKENMVQFFRNQGQRSNTFFVTKFGASHEVDNLVAFYNFCASEIWPDNTGYFWVWVFGV